MLIAGENLLRIFKIFINTVEDPIEELNKIFEILAKIFEILAKIFD